MAKETVRLQLAFEGGQIVAVTVDAAVADGLQNALADGGGVYELPSDDGTYVVSLAKLVFVRKSDRETAIGFGSAA